MSAGLALYKRLGPWLELLLISCLVLIIFCKGIEDVSFQPDESHWVYTSAFFEALEKGDFTSDIWGNRYWTLTQPPVARYIIALGRRIGGYHQDDLNHFWDFGADYATNKSRGNIPSSGLLWWSRLPMAILSAFSCLGLFILAKECAGRVAGYTLLLLFCGNVYLLTTLRRAMGEAPLLAFIVLAALAGDGAVVSWQVAADDYRSFNKLERPLGLYLAMGFFCGIAGAAKINGILTTFSGAALCILTSLMRRGNIPRPARITFAVRASVLLLLIAGLAFVAVNPHLYPDPLRRTVQMFQFRVYETRIQQEQFPKARIGSLDTRIRVVSQRVFQDYATMRFRGAQIINSLMCLLGLCYLVYTSWRWLHGSGNRGTSLVILMVALTAVIPSLFTPLDWDRYYFLPVVFSIVFIAIGISQSLSFLAKRVRDKTHKSNPLNVECRSP